MDFLKGFLAVIAIAGVAAWIWHSLRARRETPEQRALRKPRAVVAKLCGSGAIVGLVLLHWIG